MKEQWKKLDSNGKLFINVEEGQQLPLKIELPLLAVNSNKNDCCSRIDILIKSLLLISIIAFLGWFVLSIYPSFYSCEKVSLPENALLTSNNEKQNFIVSKAQAASEQTVANDDDHKLLEDESNEQSASTISIKTPPLIEVTLIPKKNISPEDENIQIERLQPNSEEIKDLFAQWHDLNARLDMLREITKNNRFILIDGSDNSLSGEEPNANSNEELSFIKNFFHAFEINDDTNKLKENDEHDLKLLDPPKPADDPDKNNQNSAEIQDAEDPIEFLFKGFLSPFYSDKEDSDEHQLNEDGASQNENDKKKGNEKELQLVNITPPSLLPLEKNSESDVKVDDLQIKEYVNPEVEETNKEDINEDLKHLIPEPPVHVAVDVDDSQKEKHIDSEVERMNKDDLIEDLKHFIPEPPSQIDLIKDTEKLEDTILTESQESSKTETLTKLMKEIIQSSLKIASDDKTENNSRHSDELLEPSVDSEDNFEPLHLLSDTSVEVNEDEEPQKVVHDLPSLIDSSEVVKNEEYKNMNEYSSFYGDYDY